LCRTNGAGGAGGCGHDKGYIKVKIGVARRLIAKGMTVEDAAEVAGVDVELVWSDD
jgi:hypothetical protein